MGVSRPQRDEPARPGPRRALGALLWASLIGVTLYTLFVAPPRGFLWDDPIRYAHAARVMVEQGDWLTVHAESFARRDGVYFKKPPLLVWLAALGFLADGGPSFAVAAGSQVLGVLVVLLSAWWGNRIVGWPFGFLAAAGLLAMPVFLENATDLRMETALALGALGACCAASVPLAPAQERWRPPLFYAGLVLAMLAKGLPGALPLLAVPLGQLAAGRTPRALWVARRPWLWWSWLLALPLLWWLQLVLRFGAEPLRALVETRGGPPFPWDTFLRTAGLPLGSSRPLWLAAALLGLALALARIVRLRRRGDVARAAACAIPASFLLLYLLGWAAKPWQSPRYQCPILPLLAMAASVPIAALWARGRALRWVAALAAALLLASLPAAWREQAAGRPAARLDARFLADFRALVGGQPAAMIYTPELKDERRPLNYRWLLYQTWWLASFYTGRGPELLDPRAARPDAPALWIGFDGEPVDALLRAAPDFELEPVLRHERLGIRLWRATPRSP